MENSLENKIVEMLKSGDEELGLLAVALFCSKKREYIEWSRIAKRAIDTGSYNPSRGTLLFEMLQKGVK